MLRVAVRLNLLGTPYAEVAGRRSDIPASKPAYVLLYLACRRDWVSREVLAELVRPEADEQVARHNLRLQLTRAKKLPWASGLELDARRVRFAAESDLEAFLAALGRGDAEAAVEAYRGPLLAGLPSLGMASFDAWLELEREHVRHAWREAALQRAQQLEREQQYQAATALLKRLWHDDELAEDVLQAYLRASYLAARSAAALVAFEHFKVKLERELGLAPLAETLELVAAVKRAAPLRASSAATAPQVPLEILRPPRLVGRSTEVEMIRAATAPAVLVAGEPGVGKTRLLEEVLPTARWLRCREGLEHVPYFPLVSYVRERLASLPASAAYRHELAKFVPEVAPDALDAAEATAGDEAKTRLLEALAYLLEAEPSPLVVDDLQWADARTLELLVLLAARARCRFYASYRSTEVSEALARVLRGWRAGRDAVTVTLAPLTAEALLHLVAELSEREEGPPRFGRWLFERSGGNPFFALETLKALFESGRLERRDGVWQSQLDALTQSYAELELPSSVAEVIRRRARGLSEEARRVLDAASVMAEGFTPGLLAQVVGLSAWAVGDALAETEARGFVTGTRFVHDVLRQSLYGAVPGARRRLLHGALAEALGPSADPLVVAEHFLAAGELERAADLWFDTATRSYDVKPGFEGEATALYERIVALGISVPALHRAKAYLANRYLGAGRYHDVSALVDAVLDEADDPRARGFALLVKAFMLLLEAQPQEAQVVADEAARHAERVGDEALTRDVIGMQATIANRLGEYRRSIALLSPLTAQYRLRPPSHGYVVHLSKLAANYSDLGEYERALALYFEQLEVAKKLTQTRNQALAYADICATYQDMGAVEKALPFAEACLALGEFDVSHSVRYVLADVYLKQGRLAEAQALAEQVLAADSSVNLRSYVCALLAELHHTAGRHDRAAATVAQGFALAAEIGLPANRCVLALAGVRYGNVAQQRRARKMLSALDLATLPAYLQADVREALERLGPSTPS